MATESQRWTHVTSTPYSLGFREIGFSGMFGSMWTTGRSSLTGVSIPVRTQRKFPFGEVSVRPP